MPWTMQQSYNMKDTADPAVSFSYIPIKKSMINFSIMVMNL